MTPDEYCRRKAADSGSSFYYGFRFLDVRRRRAIMALYAFCREVDDAVDECKAEARDHEEWAREFYPRAAAQIRSSTTGA